MADPIPFSESNKTFTAPVDHPEVLELPVYQGHGVIVSKWKFTQQEIDEISRTGELWVWIMGQTMPPVMLGVNNPFKQG